MSDRSVGLCASLLLMCAHRTAGCTQTDDIRINLLLLTIMSQTSRQSSIISVNVIPGDNKDLGLLSSFII